MQYGSFDYPQEIRGLGGQVSPGASFSNFEGRGAGFDGVSVTCFFARLGRACSGTETSRGLRFRKSFARRPDSRALALYSATTARRVCTVPESPLSSSPDRGEPRPSGSSSGSPVQSRASAWATWEVTEMPHDRRGRKKKLFHGLVTACPRLGPPHSCSASHHQGHLYRAV